MSAKRIMDLFGSVIGLIVFSLPMLVIAILVRFKIGKPVFLQERPGKNTQPFTMYKFRTMKDLYDEDGKLLPSAQRLTPFGRILRKTSMDELPELFNVLQGNMSLVGPRPLLMDYISLYNEEQNKRHMVKPGMTGWAQVNGRNTISWEERFELDVWYINNMSVKLDIKIMFLTVMKVFRSDNINPEDAEIMKRFSGSEISDQSNRVKSS